MADSLNTTTAPSGTTIEPMSQHDYDAMEMRLRITVVCGTISVVAGLVMICVYRRYWQQLRSAYNDLLVLGLGVMQLLQSAQFVIFAVIHLARLHDYTGPMCAANAILDQFFNFSGQMFALGFMVSLFTLRGHFDCCFHTSLSLSEQPQTGTVMPYTRVEHLLQRSYGSDTGNCSNGAAGGSPPSSIRSKSRFTRGEVTRFAWAALAIFGGVATTVWMSVAVMKDVDEAPQDHDVDPMNFEMGLGWCWIPEGFDTLRLLCCYLLAFFTLVCGFAAVIFLLRHEVAMSYRMHLMIYVRVGLLLLWLLVAYLIGAVSRFTQDRATTDASSFVATAVFALNETFVALIFLSTERMGIPLLQAVRSRFQNDPEELPGNGFSACVNHLLLMEVEGVPLPPPGALSQESTRWRFESDAGGSASTRRFLDQQGSVVVSSVMTIDMPM